MENASDALQMAAAVLIFVLALSISINAFGEVRQAAQTLVKYNDREYDYTYVEENTDGSGNVLTERLVGLESIIPSIYEAYRENYKIVFKDDDNATGDSILLGDEGLYRKRNSETMQIEPIYEIDLQNETLGSDTQKEQFIMAILYGDDYDDFNTLKENFQRNSGIYLNNDGLYDKINNRKLKENIGIYYQEEAGVEEDSSDLEANGSSVPEANLTEKRVITYTRIN